MGQPHLFTSDFQEWVNYGTKMQAFIEKHLLGMTSPCAGCVVPQASRFWHFLPCQAHCSAGLQEPFLAVLTNSLHLQDATLGGWKAKKKFFFPSHSSGDKGQNEIFENSPSVSPAPSFLKFMVLLSCQDPFSSKFESSFLSMSNIPLTAATLTQLQGPGKFDQPK